MWILLVIYMSADGTIDQKMTAYLSGRWGFETKAECEQRNSATFRLADERRHLTALCIEVEK